MNGMYSRPPIPPPPKDDSQNKLPVPAWWPLVGGALCGIVLRLIFVGKPGWPYAAMMGAFIYLTPLLVGMVTVYLAERQRRRSWGYYLWAPALANVIFVAGTMVILIEGIICAVLIVPLFAVLGAVGGILMGATCRLIRWPKHVVYCFATLPIILGSLESRFALPDRVETIERRILIDASPEKVWEQIWNVAPIRPEEVDRGWMYRIGVPLPVAANTQQTPDGLVRRITMEKGIHFDQVVTDWEPNRYVHWTYRFDKDSFPPAALDDHVMISGYYFDLRTTSYTLVPQGKRTQLTIRMEYRVTTPFNWYAEPIAKFVVGDFEEVVLNFYRNRSQAQSVTTPAS